METNIMKMDDLSHYLRLKLKTAYHLAAKNHIPASNLMVHGVLGKVKSRSR